MRDPLLEARLIHHPRHYDGGRWCNYCAEPFPCPTLTTQRCTYTSPDLGWCILTVGHPHHTMWPGNNPGAHLLEDDQGHRAIVTPQ